MKRVIISFLMLFVISSLYSASQDEIYIIPQPGAFGVYLGSDKYRGGETYSGGTIDGDAGLTAAECETYYTSEMLVATVTIGELSVNSYNPDTNPISVRFSVDCPDGLNFVSHQGEGSRRPFKLKVIPKIRTTYREEYHASCGYGPCDFNDRNYSRIMDDDAGTLKMTSLELSDRGSIANNILFDESPKLENKTVSSIHDYHGLHWVDWKVSETWTYDPLYYVLIFDVILVLPFDNITNTGVLTTDDGEVYQLVQAEDYTALVTLNVDFNGKQNSITIPFSGYYSANEDAKKEGSANLYVDANQKAANLSIENDWGKDDITVATANFIATFGADAANDYRLFLSASSDPFSPNNYGFELVHEDTTPMQPHTSNNSIGYTARVVLADRLRSQYSQDPGPWDFEGRSYIAAGSRDLSEDSAIHIEKRDVIEDFTTYGGKISASVYEFEGDINIIIDAPENIDEMLPGRYVSDIYVHVVDVGA